MSTKSAGLAKKMGYTNIKVMLAGEPGWKESGNVTVSSIDYVKLANIALVDLREQDSASKGYIPRAVNIPFSRLEDAEEDFPSFMGAPVIFYGDGDQASTAVKIARKWGYNNSTIVEGGLDGWVSAGLALYTGKPGSEITYVRKLGPGEVSIEEFRSAVKNPASGVMILDVRNADEAAQGKFKSSINIPLDYLQSRMTELSPDKEYLIHCSTGIRAEMAHHILKKANIKSRFVMATVEFEGPDNYDIYY